MFGYAYKFTMIPTGKIYVGKKESPVFLDGYWGSGRDWKLELEKYGKENVSREIIDWADNRKDLKEKEVYWIAKLNAQDSNIGYNVHKGGNGGNMVGDAELWSEMHRGEKNGRFGKEVSQTTRDKISAANSCKKRTKEQREHLSKALKGKKKPKSYSEKLSKRMKGVPKSAEQKAKISAKLTGTSWGHHTEESRAKISKALLGHANTNGMTGKKHTSEAKQKMSAILSDGRRKGGNNSRAVAVVCVETGEKFDCIKYAEEATGATHISAVCKGKLEVSRKINLHWRYATDED